MDLQSLRAQRQLLGMPEPQAVLPEQVAQMAEQLGTAERSALLSVAQADSGCL
jgi:hypothetical protein